MSTANKLQYLIDAKISISAAIEAKGGDVPQELSGYGPAIEALPSGCDLDKLTYFVNTDNTISGHLFEGILSSSDKALLSNATNVQLGNAVTSIGGSAFSSNRGLTSITIPDSVTSIGPQAFRNCTGLTSVTIPDSVLSIGELRLTEGPATGAFDQCSNLISVDFGDGMQMLGVAAFQNCINLSSITPLPNSLTVVSFRAFRSCSSLPSITFPNSLTDIGARAFQGCSSCLTFDFSSATSVPTLNNVNAFGETNANKKIIVPDALYDQWKATSNWNSSTNGIVDAITKASEA